MTSEAPAHRGEDFVAEVILSSGREPRVQRGGQNWGRRAYVDGCDARPAALARIGHSAREAGQIRALQQSLGGEIEQPGGDDAATTPEFRHRGQVERVLVQLRLA